jgi:uncharacterized protein
VVIRGEATLIDGDDKVAALQVINDHIAAIWDIARPPSEIDLKQTMVLSVPLTEASAKIRGGDPIDDDADLEGPWWAGVVPLRATWGTPVPAGDLRDGIAVPSAVSGLTDTDAHPI